MWLILKSNGLCSIPRYDPYRTHVLLLCSNAGVHKPLLFPVEVRMSHGDVPALARYVAIILRTTLFQPSFFSLFSGTSIRKLKREVRQSKQVVHEPKLLLGVDLNYRFSPVPSFLPCSILVSGETPTPGLFVVRL